MQRHPSSVSRRTVSAGLAWSVPSVAAVAAAPAHAASPPDDACVPAPGTVPAPADSAYALVGNVFTSYLIDGGIECDRDGEVGLGEGTLNLDNESFPATEGPVDPVPAGFAVVEQPMTDGSGALSPKIEVTLPAPVQLVVAYPAGLVDRSGGGDYFEFYDDADGNWTGDNWTAPVYTGTQTLGGGESGQKYDIFTFTWRGNRTQSTVTPPAGGGESPQAWAATTLNGTWTTSVAICLPPEKPYLGAYYVGGAGNLADPPAITTSNCAAVAPDTAIWRILWERAPRG